MVREDYQMFHSRRSAWGQEKEAVMAYRDWGIRSGLLHAYCGCSFSFDTAKCGLLFYDWFVQKYNKSKRDGSLERDGDHDGILSGGQ